MRDLQDLHDARPRAARTAECDDLAYIAGHRHERRDVAFPADDLVSGRQGVDSPRAEPSRLSCVAPPGHAVDSCVSARVP